MGALMNKQSDILPEEYRNKTIDSLPTEILLPLLKAAAGNNISNLAKLKLVCRRFNYIINASSQEFTQLCIRRLRFSHETRERSLKIFGYVVRKIPSPISVSILYGTYLPVVPFLGPNDLKLSELLRHFKITGGRLTFSRMKVTDKLIAEILSLDLSNIEELKFYGAKLDISPYFLKALLEKMSNSLQNIKLLFCQFSPLLISDDMLNILCNFNAVSIIENNCGEIHDLSNLTLSSLLQWNC